MTERVFAITAFRLTTADPAGLPRFYEGLGFELEAQGPIPAAEIALMGLNGGGTRFSLRLGISRLDLDCFDQPGRPYPMGSTSADLCFQHFALVTDDAAAAWTGALALGATPISRDGPVTLPASTGGVTAAKFRDPEGHPLEFLQFPHCRGHDVQGDGLLAIDHSAISVSARDTSRRFYESLGLSVHHPTLNQGPTQDSLDGLPAVSVDVVPMKPVRDSPHLELLAYREPIGRSMGHLEANDVAATRIVWTAERDTLLRDPDGHLHLLLR